jgi:hypothetical protein
MKKLTEQQFREAGLDAVNEALAAFYTLGDDDRSELYQLMPPPERNKFLASHDQLSLSVPKSGVEAKIYAGPSGDFSRALAYPFDPMTFADDILSGFGRHADGL